MVQADLGAGRGGAVNEDPFLAAVCAWARVRGAVVGVERAGAEVSWCEAVASEMRFTDPAALGVWEDDGDADPRCGEGGDEGVDVGGGELGRGAVVVGYLRELELGRGTVRETYEDVHVDGGRLVGGDEVGVEGGGADVPRQCRALVQDPGVAASSGRVTGSLGGQQHGYVMWTHSALRSTASGYCNVKASFLSVSSPNTTPSSPQNTRTTDLGLPYSYIS